MSTERDADTTINCFIIAPPGQLSDLLRQQFNQEGVLCLRLDITEPAWQSSVQVTSLIERSDFVAAILEGEPSANLYFELGLAVGKGKPLLVFDESSKVPAALSSATTVLTSAIRNDGWKDLRRAFLRTVKPKRTEPKRKTPKKQSSRSRWRELRSEFESLQTSATEAVGRKFEQLVESAFQLADFPISQSPTPDFGADFALASPKLVRSLGSPLLVEVRNNSRMPVQQKTIDRLDQLISEGRGGAALLTTTVPLLPTIHLDLQHPIVIVPFSELLSWLENGTFEDEFLFTLDSFWTRPS
jgi:hypothetical protein